MKNTLFHMIHTALFIWLFIFTCFYIFVRWIKVKIIRRRFSTAAVQILARWILESSRLEEEFELAINSFRFAARSRRRYLYLYLMTLGVKSFAPMKKKRKRREMPNTKAWEINKHRELQLKAMKWYQQMLYIFCASASCCCERWKNTTNNK